MERVVGNPANPLRGRERGGFDNSPNWEKVDRPICAWVYWLLLVLFFTVHVRQISRIVFCALVSNDDGVFDRVAT